ncbi:MAG TPA: hypothetical protein VK388_01430 [Pyrinomonadaceae bacterium]|nr:hypothetical protein [Pyrinomonadaceae bacterium]
MNCQKCKNEIEETDLRRESLSRAAEAHVAACESCRRFGDERLALRRLVGGLEKVSAPADFDFRMRALMVAERGVRAPRAKWFNLSPAALSWPLAGCLALVISASLYFQPRQPETPPPAATQAQQSGAAATIASPQTSIAEVALQSDQAVNDKTRPGVTVASSRISPAPERRRSALARLAVAKGVERKSAQVEESTSTSLTGSTPRFATSGATRSESALIPVPLDAPEGQLKVLLRDTSGAARTISVDSVSFGSRDVMRRPGATYSRASLSSNQGVW